MTTTNHPSGLPEQEPTSPTAVVLCGDESWVNTAMGWESLTQWLAAWGDLRDFAAEKGGATLFDPADLPTGLTEAQKGAIRSAWATLTVRGHDVSAGVIRDACPEVFADDRVTVTWKSGDSDDVWAELLRVACMDGASVVGIQGGVTYSGMVFAAHSDQISIGCTSTGGPALAITPWGVDWTVTVTVTAPKPVDPTGGDPVVRASLVAFVDYKKCIFFRAQDGLWSRSCGSERGMWGTAELAEIERLSAQTIAELMGGAS